MQRSEKLNCQLFKYHFMRKIILLPILFLTAVIFYSCLKDKVTHTYTLMRPVYKSKTEVYANIKSNAPQSIESPGKLYMYGNYIFLNDIDKGVHIIDNTNPSNPVVKAFINIPGNLDIAVKGNTLYADLFTDMVVIDITNPLSVRFEKFIPFVFPFRTYGYGFIADSNNVVVDWIKKDTSVEYYTYNNWNKRDAMLFSSASSVALGTGGGGSVSVPGVAGSMARMSIVNNYMYCVNNYELRSFDINNALNPHQVASSNAGWQIETIYPFRNKLFLGSASGMFIYDITNPATPVREGQFQHARACDPVISDGNYAYVTLHDGTNCQGFSNQLDVVNITNLSAPSLLRTYALTHPHGLSKDGDLLFVCDGRDGLKMYDASSPGNLTLKKHIPGIETYDAIAWNNNLVVVAKDGLYQYDYSNSSNLVQRSKISVDR
ncbi:MAG: hypothetical protein E6H07_09835 [Bacteroidetes bacterium]|nr:MAG: hypothetical protein E6H07_09835 [Bacteroidota bacterium]